MHFHSRYQLLQLIREVSGSVDGGDSSDGGDGSGDDVNGGDNSGGRGDGVSGGDGGGDDGKWRCWSW